MGAPRIWHTPTLCHPPWISCDVRDLGTSIRVGILYANAFGIAASSVGSENQSLRSMSVLGRLGDAGTYPGLSSPYLLPYSVYQKSCVEVLCGEEADHSTHRFGWGGASK